MNKSVVILTIGYMCIGFVTWESNLDAAGWITGFSGYAMVIFLTLGTALLGTMALLAFFYSHPLDSIIFFGYAGMYWSLQAGLNVKITTAADAWFLLLWAIFFLYLWLSSFKLGRARSLFLLVTWVGLAVCVLPDVIHLEIFRTIRGYLGLLTALIAIYMSAAAVLNTGSERSVLRTNQRP